MIRKVIIAVSLLMIGLGSFAQYGGHMPSRVNTYSDDGDGNGFLKQNLFLGGSLGLGFGTDQFSVGVNPEIGYSLFKWLDAGLVVNFNYNSISADPTLYFNDNTAVKQFTYGGGVFGRAFVLPFLFLTAQPEVNWISTTETYEGTGGGSYKSNTSAGSLLLGAGYSRRIIGQSSFYFALMFDVAGSTNSPYNDIYGRPLPVIRAGFDIYLHGRNR
jgi:hypothetical protein